ncbi:MAG: hypothetical protein PHR53_05240 [Bacteroidales bacterium]|nr:hypothetical protein [Bacteroidales bacterium]
MKKIIVSLFILLPLCVVAQDLPYASSRLDTSEIIIGEQVKLTVEIKAHDEVFLWNPFPTELCEGVEVVKQLSIDTLIENGTTLYRQELFVTAFDTGFYIIPPIDFPYHKAGDTTVAMTSAPALFLTVNTITVDTAQAFRDIKGLKEVPVTFKEVLLTAYPWAILAAVLVGLYFLGRYLYKRYKNKQPIFELPKKPKLPAHIIAFDALDKLKEKKLWQSDRVKDYYSELTDIVDQYIEDRFEVSAVEMTTDEILSGLANHSIPPKDMEKLTATLQSADLVKFAKSNPLPLENDNAWNFIYDFVKDTKLEHSVVEETKENADIQDNTTNKDTQS